MQTVTITIALIDAKGHEVTTWDETHELADNIDAAKWIELRMETVEREHRKTTKKTGTIPQLKSSATQPS